MLNHLHYTWRLLLFLYLGLLKARPFYCSSARFCSRENRGFISTSKDTKSKPPVQPVVQSVAKVFAFANKGEPPTFSALNGLRIHPLLCFLKAKGNFAVCIETRRVSLEECLWAFFGSDAMHHSGD